MQNRFSRLPNVGKTKFAKILARSLNKHFFSLALGEISELSFLLGSEPSSPGNKEGQLARALIEAKSPDPVILLDEIDKAGSPSRPAIHNALLAVLDPVQNQEVNNYFLGTKLDFSQVTFIATANDYQNISHFLRSRLEVIELKEYTSEEKKQIAKKIIQEELTKHSINPNLLEFPEDNLNILINKTNEKGVRQLELGIKRIFRHCLLKWAEQAEQGQIEQRIIITPETINQAIPRDFINVDREESKEDRLGNLQKELDIFRKEKAKSMQNKLAVNKLVSLRIIQQNLNKTNLKKENLEKCDYDYEEKIINSSSYEEVEAIREEILLLIAQKSPTKTERETWKIAIPKQVVGVNREGKANKEDAKIQNLKRKLTEINQWKDGLENQLISLQKQSFSELQNLQNEVNELKLKQEKTPAFSWRVEKNPWFIIAVASFTFWGTYGIFKLKSSKRTKSGNNTHLH